MNWYKQSGIFDFFKKKPELTPKEKQENNLMKKRLLNDMFQEFLNIEEDIKWTGTHSRKDVASLYYTLKNQFLQVVKDDMAIHLGITPEEMKILKQFLIVTTFTSALAKIHENQEFMDKYRRMGISSLTLLFELCEHKNFTVTPKNLYDKFEEIWHSHMKDII